MSIFFANEIEIFLRPEGNKKGIEGHAGNKWQVSLRTVPRSYRIGEGKSGGRMIQALSA